MSHRITFIRRDKKKMDKNPAIEFGIVPETTKRELYIALSSTLGRPIMRLVDQYYRELSLEDLKQQSHTVVFACMTFFTKSPNVRHCAF